MKKNNRDRKKKKNAVPKLLTLAERQHLRPLCDQLQTGFTFRFITTGTGGSASATITYANLLDAWCVAVSATSARQLFDFIKIKKVTVRATSNPAGSGLGLGATVGIEYPGLVAGTAAGGKQASDSAVGTSNVAYVSLSPDRMSANAMWQSSTSNIAFVLRAVDWSGGPIVGALIDVDVALKNSADVNPAAVTSAVSGATTGELYFRGIDGAAPAATWARSVFPARI